MSEAIEDFDRELEAIKPHPLFIMARLEIAANLLDHLNAPKFAKVVREALQLYHNKSVELQNREADLTFKPFDHYCVPTDDALVLARTDDGRMMIWKWSILKSTMDPSTPDHLQFPATGWIDLRMLRPSTGR